MDKENALEHAKISVIQSANMKKAIGTSRDFRKNSKLDISRKTVANWKVREF